MQYILIIRPGISVECRQKIEAVLKESCYDIKSTASMIEDERISESEIVFENEET